MFAVGLTPLGLAAFLFIAAPNGPSGMYLQEPGPIWLIVPAIGVMGLAVGLLWMVRIFRADPEPRTKSWRYRD